MKHLLVRCFIGLCLVATAASATSVIMCGDQTNDATGVGGNTLDKYISLGASGCTIGNVVFSNFSYSYSLGTDSFYSSGPKGTGAQQNASSVTVAVFPVNDEFQFGANWVVNHYQTASLSLSFTVSALNPELINKLQSALTATQGGTQNGGPISSSQVTCTGGTCGSPTNFTNAIVNIANTTGPLAILNTVTMNANGSTNSSTNNYHLSIIADQFAATAPPQVVPEPTTYLLTSAGIGAIALLRRRKLTASKR